MIRKKNKISARSIAICGMNCHLCMAYKRAKNGCLGCREEIGTRFKYVNRCKIRNCEKAVNGKLRFCFQCESYPCKNIKQIDKRYRTRYSMSMMENFAAIRQSGIRKFLVNEEKKWSCPGCGQLLSVHRRQCRHCQYTWR